MEWPHRVSTKLAGVPDKPGCYIMRDGRGKIIYVGKAFSLRRRLRNYFGPTALRRADAKLRSLIRSIQDFDILITRNEAEALLTEGKLIKEYKPYYNIAFKDDKRFILVRADPRDPFPVLSLCRLRRDDGAIYFGPYVSSAAARAGVDFVERTFGLRKCAPHIPDESTYKHCHNDVIRFCSAPCVGRISREEYAARFADACAFFEGRKPGLLAELRGRMEESARAMDFEKAAALRDTLRLLQTLIRERGRVLKTPQMKREEAVSGLDTLARELGLPSAPHRIDCFDVSTISGTYAVASMVCALNGRPARNQYRRFRIKTVTGSDDPAMMAEVIHRRYSRVKEESGPVPDLVVVDGGVTQSGAARRELDRLGLETIPVIGLAKRYEEIHVPGRNETIRLDDQPAALRILQQLRDEAHRFAIDYHRKIREQKIKESVLDDVPGIGASKKMILLRHFGSVRKIMQADEEQVARVPGIGYKLAKVIANNLGLGKQETARKGGSDGETKDTDS